MILDNLCVFLSILAGFWLVERGGVLRSSSFWSMVLEAMLVNLVVIIVLDTYHSVLHHSPWDELVRLLSQTGYVILILLVLRLLNRMPGTDLVKVARYAVPLYILTCFTARQIYKGFLKKKHHIRNRHSLLIALEASQIPTVVPRILRSNYGVYRFSYCEEAVRERIARILPKNRRGKRSVRSGTSIRRSKRSPSSPPPIPWNSI